MHTINAVYPSGRSETLTAKNKPELAKKIAKLRALYGQDVAITNSDGRRL